MDIRTAAANMKLIAPELASSSIEARNRALELIAKALEDKKEEIFSANAIDMEEAEKNNIPAVVKNRLKYNEAKLHDSIEGLKGLINLPDPVGKVLLKTELDDGLMLEKVSVPIGVIGVIFEARPDAMVQVASLCIKSGNCAVLKGGKETLNSNRVLFEIINDALAPAGLPEGCLFRAESHSEIDELLKCDNEVDLIIPRGSNAFVRHIMDNTRIPVMGHSEGICHIYVDKAADIKASIPIIIDAKTQYPAACNAVETLLIHRDIADSFLPVINDAFDKAGVKMKGSREVAEALKKLCDKDIEIIEEEDFTHEYGDLCISLKLVSDVEEAERHINIHGSHHTDAILTEDKKTADHFTSMVDSAGVYVNCSTRFADGYRYGFGAEVGISTGKLHARGPVGLDGLVTYKYKITGSGQTVTDYVSGKSSFKHKRIL